MCSDSKRAVLTSRMRLQSVYRLYNLLSRFDRILIAFQALLISCRARAVVYDGLAFHKVKNAACAGLCHTPEDRELQNSKYP